MKTKTNIQLHSLIILTLLMLSGCSDSSTQEISITSAQENQRIPDQMIETSNYIFSIFKDPQGDLFSIRNHDQSDVALNISKDELMSIYPDAFDELILDGLSDGLDNKIYYDDQNMNRVRMVD